LIGFQFIVSIRFTPAYPDDVLPWVARITATYDPLPAGASPTERLATNQAGWDSVYYLTIATEGYAATTYGAVDLPDGETLSVNYAFYPFYPFSMAFLAAFVKVLAFTPWNAAVIAGVIVSLLGALGGALAIFDLALADGDEADASRAAFYLLIFPVAFFMAQVYTEGLFIGLAFGSLALARRRRFLWASVLAALAVLTRATGILLVIPLALYLLDDFREHPADGILRGLYVLPPLAALIIWWVAFGSEFSVVQAEFFGRGTLDLPAAWEQWQVAFRAIGAGENPQAVFYYLTEIAFVVAALAACALTFRQYPYPAVFGLAVILIAVTSGPVQSFPRYMLAVPGLYLLLARWGRSPLFDRAWSLASVLLLAFFTMLFTLDYWVG
ncbi:MAG: hypothetical protein GYB64_19990, partial [Chloroflexi bacterium]|nr:hypothetical protein [Chloroflexota bacterium]